MQALGSVLTILALIGMFVVWPQVKYAIKLWIYFKLHESNGQAAVTRVNPKPRKIARVAVK